MNVVEVDYSYFISNDHWYRWKSWVDDATLRNTEQSMLRFGTNKSEQRMIIRPNQRKKRLIASDGHVNIIGVSPMSSL